MPADTIARFALLQARVRDGLAVPEREFSRVFDVDDRTLRRRSAGQSVPLTALGPSIHRWLGEHPEHKLPALVEEHAVVA